MYTLGKQGGKTVAVVHGIYTVCLDEDGRELGRRGGWGQEGSLRADVGVNTASRVGLALGWRGRTNKHQTNRRQTNRRGARALCSACRPVQDGLQRDALCRVDARFNECGCNTRGIAVFIRLHKELRWIRSRIRN